MGTYDISTPISFEDINKLIVGDIVYLSGIIYTARDEAHAHILNMDSRKEKLPFELEKAVIYHCGPLIVKKNAHWEVIAAGPTTSARMSKMTPKLLKNHKIHALIGKGGMLNMAEVFKNKCVYLAYTGGCATLAAESVIDVKAVYWPELGMPEAVWELDVKKFGPLIVGIDSHGNDIYEQIQHKAKQVFERMKSDK